MLGQNLRKKNLAFQNILCTHLYKNMIEQKRDEKSLNFLCMSCKTNIWHYIYFIHDTYLSQSLSQTTKSFPREKYIWLNQFDINQFLNGVTVVKLIIQSDLINCLHRSTSLN